MRVALTMAALATAGCTQMYEMPAVRSACVSNEVGESPFRAAAVTVDITPPMGLSLAGHGLEARISTGLLTHLYCRGFIFEKRPERLAWLACDLQGVSLVLQRRVAELVREETGLGADRILLSAVHTHAAPGHIYDARAYSTELGGTRQAAYDQRVVDFVASRIARGIVRAYGALEDAHVRTWTGDDSICVTGLSRNRAVLPFSRNERKDVDLLLPCERPDAPPDYARRHVDRRLALVYVETRRGTPIGVMGVFSVHGTAMPNYNELYHGDLFEFATIYCENVLPQRLRVGPNKPFVCAIANGSEGDVSPDWTYQGEGEARYLGERLGAHVADTIAAANGPADRPWDQPHLEARYLEVNFPAAGTPKGPLCRYPELGTPAGGGAPDGPTRLRFWEQFNAGMINVERSEKCAGPRIAVLLAGNTESARNGLQFPVQAPITWMRIGEASFLTLPMEPTTMLGLGLAAVIDGPTPVRRTHVVGLTSGYVSYAATEAEYDVQFYEGASTVYGRYRGPDDHTAAVL